MLSQRVPRNARAGTLNADTKSAVLNGGIDISVKSCYKLDAADWWLRIRQRYFIAQFCDFAVQSIDDKESGAVAERLKATVLKQVLLNFYLPAWVIHARSGE